jgi:glyoxylase I family protein
MYIKAIAHASFIVADIDVALKFYCDVLGLTVDTQRPDLGYPGAWLEVCALQQIHLLQLPNPDPLNGRPPHGGRDRHVAFTVNDLTAVQARLQHYGITFQVSRSGRAALFCRDPDQNTLEFIQA